MDSRDYTSRILLFTCGAHALTHIYMIVYAPLLLTMGEELSLDRHEVAFFFTLSNVFFGLGSVPAGWLGDRFGEKVLLLGFFAGCAVGGSLIGMATSPWTLGAGAVVLGLATSIYHPVGTALISKGIERRGRALGINGIAGSVGTALGPVLAAIAAASLGWRWAYIGMAIPTLAMGTALLVTDLGPAAEPVPRGAGSGHAHHRPRLRRPGPSPGRVALFVFLLVAMTLGGFYYHLVTTILPKVLSNSVSAEGVAENREAWMGGLKAGLALTFGAVGQFTAGVLSDRFDQRRLYVLNYMLIVPLVFLFGLAQGAWVLVLACVSSTFFFAVQPIENTLIARYTPARWRGATYGAKFILVFALGGTGTWVAAWIAEKHPTVWAFYIATAVASLALICAVVAWRVPLEDSEATAATT